MHCEWLTSSAPFNKKTFPFPLLSQIVRKCIQSSDCVNIITGENTRIIILLNILSLTTLKHTHTHTHLLFFGKEKNRRSSSQQIQTKDAMPDPNFIHCCCCCGFFLGFYVILCHSVVSISHSYDY